MSTSTAARDAAAEAARPWWQVGLAAAALAAVGNLLVFALVEAAFGHDLRVPNQQTGGMMDLGPAMVTIFTVLPALFATLLAAYLARRSARPRGTFLTISLVLLVLSFLTPLLVDVDAGTRLTLEVMHLVAAAAIVGTLFSRLPVDAR